MIEMAASRQVSHTRPSMYQVASQVIAKDGIAGLYKGIGTTVTRAAVLGATKMATYDVVKTELRNSGWAEGRFGVRRIRRDWPRNHHHNLAGYEHADDHREVGNGGRWERDVVGGPGHLAAPGVRWVSSEASACEVGQVRAVRGGAVRGVGEPEEGMRHRSHLRGGDSTDCDSTIAGRGGDEEPLPRG